jgi:hypothetical protein
LLDPELVAQFSDRKWRLNGKMKTFSIQRLNELLILDPVTCKLYWRPRKLSEFTCQRLCNSWNTRRAGTEALACPNESGHLCGTFDGEAIYAHKAVWAIFYGEWPKIQIDHINHNAADNRIENLRLAPQSENVKNKKLYKRNKTGTSGVGFRNGKWYATIKVGGRDKWLGTYIEKDLAVNARVLAQAEYGYHANHGS